MSSSLGAMWSGRASKISALTAGTLKRRGLLLGVFRPLDCHSEAHHLQEVARGPGGLAQDEPLHKEDRPRQEVLPRLPQGPVVPVPQGSSPPVREVKEAPRRAHFQAGRGPPVLLLYRLHRHGRPRGSLALQACFLTCPAGRPLRALRRGRLHEEPPPPEEPAAHQGDDGPNPRHDQPELHEGITRYRLPHAPSEAPSSSSLARPGGLPPPPRPPAPGR